VGGIKGGLEIKGQGTLVLDMNDDNGKPHHIHIPNSLYLPDLRMCLLSPQHWAQERETIILCQMARGWKTRQTIAF
jgi:hypothetical protein